VSLLGRMTRTSQILAVFALLLTGCATKNLEGSPPRIGHGAEDYQKITAQALASVQKALHWLDRVGAETNHCPPKVVTGFSREVDQLEIESLRIQEHAQAIRARGDAYFEAWSANLSAGNGPQNGKAAEYLPQLREAFAKIKQTSQQAGDAFKPFFDGLRKLQTQLELNPGAIENADTRELVRSAREYGSQVEQNLSVLKDELVNVIPVLERAKSEANL
jgi:hypothetical protein